MWRSLVRFEYGAAPAIQLNKHQTTNDVRILEEILGVGFFQYGPRLWMFGEVEPMKDLQTADMAGDGGAADVRRRGGTG